MITLRVPYFVQRAAMTLSTVMLLGGLLLSAAAPSASAAEHPFGGFHAFHGRNIHAFGPHELGIWRGGIWRQEWHNGLFGWWWFVAGEWYLYPTPIYPYPTVVSETVVVDSSAPPPPTVVVSPGASMPASQAWWYCDNPAGYYPHVPVCSVPFRPVAPMQSPPPSGYAPPPGAAVPPPGTAAPPPPPPTH